MNAAPSRPCRVPGCSGLAEKLGCCAVHAVAAEKRSAASRSRFDARRGSAASRGYDSDWSKAAKIFRARYPLAHGYFIRGPNWSVHLAMEFHALREALAGNLREFLKRRAEWLALTQCYVIVRDGEVGGAEEVDHIIPHRGDDTLRLSEWNFQPIPHGWHSEKTATYDGGFRGAAS